ARNSVETFSGLQPWHDFGKSQFSLTADNDIDIRGSESLCCKRRRMPSAEDHWKLRVFRFYSARNLDRFVNHGAGDYGNSETDRFIDLVENFLLKARFNRGIDNLNAVALTLKYWRQCQQRKRWRRFDTSV